MKFITLYGVNNIGKSTQGNLLVERIRARGRKVLYVKYPVYDLAPTGPLLNEFLRHGNPHNFSAREAQILYTLNRTQMQKTIEKALENGNDIVAEDYIGTSIAWGVGTGVSKKFLIELQTHLLVPSTNILLHGTRFLDSRERGHVYEQNDTLSERVCTLHLELAREFGWDIVHANDDVSVVHDTIWKIVERDLQKM